MKYFITAMLLLTVSACNDYPGRKLNDVEYAAVDDVISRWQDAGLDEIGPTCWHQYEEMMVVIADTQDDMVYWTGYCGPSGPGPVPDTDSVSHCRWGRAASAYHLTGPIWDQYPRFIVWHTIPTDQALEHEAVHWLQECTGRGWNAYSAHSDSQVWCPSGCPGIWNP